MFILRYDLGLLFRNQDYIDMNALVSPRFVWDSVRFRLNQYDIYYRNKY